MRVRTSLPDDMQCILHVRLQDYVPVSRCDVHEGFEDLASYTPPCAWTVSCREFIARVELESMKVQLQ